MRAIPNALLFAALALSGCSARTRACPAGERALNDLFAGHVAPRSMALYAWARGQSWSHTSCSCVSADETDRYFQFKCADGGWIALGVPWSPAAPPAGPMELKWLRHWPTRPADEKALPDADYEIR